MNYVRSEYYDIWYDDRALRAFRVDYPHSTDGSPSVVTHKDVGLLSVIFWRETRGYEGYDCLLQPFPAEYKRLMTFELVRAQLKLIDAGKLFYSFCVTPYGMDILQHVPAPFLVNNLIRCFEYTVKHFAGSEWPIVTHLVLFRAAGLLIQNMSMDELPEFLVNEHPEIRRSAEGRLSDFI